MKALTKLTVATLAVAAIGAVAVHTIEAHVISPVATLHQDGAADSKTYADWQGPRASLSARGSLPKARHGMRSPAACPAMVSPCPSSRAGEHAGGAHVVPRRTLVNAGVRTEKIGALSRAQAPVVGSPIS